MLPLTDYTIDIKEVTYAKISRPGVVHTDHYEIRVPSRDYKSWPSTIKPEICGFRLFSEMEGPVPGKTLDNGRPLTVSSNPFRYSDFYYCNAIVMPWEEAKKRYSGYNEDPHKADMTKWSGEFWQAGWRLDIKVFYFKTDGKVHVPIHGFSSAFPTGFIVDEHLNSSEVK